MCSSHTVGYLYLPPSGSLPRYLAASLPRYLATSLPRYGTTASSAPHPHLSDLRPPTSDLRPLHRRAVGAPAALAACTLHTADGGHRMVLHYTACLVPCPRRGGRSVAAVAPALIYSSADSAACSTGDAVGLVTLSMGQHMQREQVRDLHACCTAEKPQQLSRRDSDECGGHK
jgi:hypothetical protein